MRLFTCSACKQILFFENVRCGRCGHQLAYLPEHKLLSAIEERGGTWTALVPEAGGERYRLCDNYVRHAVCNWALPADSEDALCRSCRLNRVIPNLGTSAAKQAWQTLETAKRRVLYTLNELGMPVEPTRGGERGLAFSFMEDQAGERVFTGHRDGLITINIAEADPAYREKMRCELGEAYRTVLGHIRHELGHYYWDVLIRDTRWHERFRAEFGDERADYAQAKLRNYEHGPQSGWETSFVSAYAAMHPWEDWAESFAHYLHMVDTLETARSYGLVLRPVEDEARLLGMAARRLQFGDFDDLIGGWVPLTMALNSLNRSMGLADPYPFVLSERAVAKLRFVHEVVESAAASDASPRFAPAG